MQVFQFQTHEFYLDHATGDMTLFTKLELEDQKWKKERIGKRGSERAGRAGIDVERLYLPWSN